MPARLVNAVAPERVAPPGLAPSPSVTGWPTTGPPEFCTSTCTGGDMIWPVTAEAGSTVKLRPAPGVLATVILSGCIAVVGGVLESVTCTVNPFGPGVVGMPRITPALFSDGR